MTKGNAVRGVMWLVAWKGKDRKKRGNRWRNLFVKELGGA